MGRGKPMVNTNFSMDYYEINLRTGLRTKYKLMQAKESPKGKAKLNPL